MAVSRRYPKYDWSGIAMLTQQLGGLFEPSKGKLLREEQEHEMRILEAKQAWKKYNKLRPDHTQYVKNLKIKEKADEAEQKLITKEMTQMDNTILPKKKPINWESPK